LLHDIGFDPRSSPIGNMALNVGIPLGIEKQGLFFRFIAYTKSKRKFKKNPATKIT